MKPIIVILLFFVLVSVFPQTETIDLSGLGAQFSVLLKGIGRDLLPAMQQSVMAGDIMGSATVNKLGVPVYIVLPGVGVTFFDGFLTVLDDKQAFVESSGEFTFGGTEGSDPTTNPLLLPNLVENVLSSLDDPSAATYVGYIKNVFALPTPRIGFGFGLPWGIEFHANGMVIPDALVDWVLGLAGQQALAETLTADIYDFGVRLTKVISPGKGFLPALSLGAGYYHSSVGIGATFTSLADIDPVSMANGIDIAGMGALDFKGSVAVDTTVDSIGVDLHLSKDLFILTPFVRLSPYFYWSRFNANAGLTAVLKDSGGEVASESELDSGSDETLTGLNIFTTAGVEINLFFLILHVSATVNLDYPEFNLGDAFNLDFSQTKLNKLGLNVGVRIRL